MLRHRKASVYIIFSLGVILGVLIRVKVYSLPSNFDKNFTLQILNALLLSGTVLFGLAGVLITFTLNLINGDIDSLRKDRLAIWIAFQNAYFEHLADSNKLAQLQSIFQDKLDNYDALISKALASSKSQLWFVVMPLMILIGQLLITIAAMAEAAFYFPYELVYWSIFCLLGALLALALIVMRVD